MLQKRQEEDMHALNRAENEFRALHQQPASRREWDLYDPDALKKDKPARVHDDDPRCGISSLQKFDGEDLNSKVGSCLQKDFNFSVVFQLFIYPHNYCTNGRIAFSFH